MWQSLGIACFLATIILLQLRSGICSVPFVPARFGPTTSVTENHHDCGIASNVLLCPRGGASKKSTKSKRGAAATKTTATGQKQVGAGDAAAKEKSSVSGALKWYSGVKPLTRIHITMACFFTLLGLVLGEELSQGLLALDTTRFLYGFEVWRPFTAASYLGKPSVGMLFSVYYLFEYGTQLERAYGTPQHLIFLMTQMVMLTILSSLFRQPFFSQSLITAMLHVLSRSMPKQNVKWLIFTIPYFLLPYGLMVTDMLQAQGDVMAMLPHVLGILSGHFYYFHKFIWPKDGGEDWLIAPDFLVKRLSPEKPKPVVLATATTKRKPGRKLSSSRK